jgi:hypothetical protein
MTTNIARKPGPPRVTVITTPAYPVPGKSFRLRAERILNSTTGTHVRIWCLAAPRGTKLRKQLDDSRAGRISLVALLPITDPTTSANQHHVDLTLEKGGGYVLQVDEILVGNVDYPGFTGGYEGDPRGAPGETVKSNGVTTIYVAQGFTMQLGCGAETATLKLYVHDATVVQTELAVHGETTPRIDLGSSATARARLAAENSFVRDAAAALAGQLATTLVGDIGSSLDNEITKYNAHLKQSRVHLSNDEDNAVNGSFLGATTAPARAAALSELRRLFTRHAKNDSGSGTGSAGYHSAADWQGLPLDAASPSDALNDAIAHADMWRAYEAHRLSTVHPRTDGTNKLTALPPLLELHRAFLAVLAQSSADTPATGQSAGALLVSQMGAREI